MTRMRGHVLTVTVGALFALAFALAYLFGARALPGTGGDHDLELRVPTAASLAAGSKVTVAGLRAGTITSVERATNGGAVVGMKIEDDFWPLAADSTGAMRLHSLIGENYIDIAPGVADTKIGDGGTIRLAQNVQYVEADQILSALRGDVRERTRELIGGLGDGLDGRGEALNHVLRDVSGVLGTGDELMEVLQDDHRTIARLVDNVGVVTGTIADRGNSVRELAQGLRGSLTAIASRDAAVRATLRELPAALSSISRVSSRLSDISAHAGPSLAELGGAIEALAPAISLLRPTASEGRELVAELGQAAPRLQGTLAELRRTSAPATDALPEVRAILCEANPALRYLEPYAKEIPNVLTNMASASNYYDANGHAGRLIANVGENTLVGLDEGSSQAVNTLLNSGLLGKTYYRGWNPYPAPGKAGETQDVPGVGVEPGASSKLPYTRVKADC